MNAYLPEVAPASAPASGVYYAPVAGTIAPLYEVQWSSIFSLDSENILVFQAGPTGVEGEIPVN
jgi:hypothetical protein